jgi:hypothetical protein
MDVYLNFSHFVNAGDYGIIHPDCQWIPLVRGMAYQCADNQKSTDLFVPAHHGGIAAPIGPGNTSAVYGQIKNRVRVTDVVADPHVGGTSMNELPTLSLVHDLGLQESRVYSHYSMPARELRGGETHTQNIHIRHYQINIEGCTHETYAVIPPEKSDVYKSILCATSINNDFARIELEGHRQAMLRLKPAFYSSEPESSLEWIGKNPSRIFANAKGLKGKRKEHPAVSGTASSSIIGPLQVRNY